MKKIIGALLIMALFACVHPKKDNTLAAVSYKGAIKNYMKNGDLSAKANLIDFKDTPHFFALGVVENLKGEIQIFDSQPYNTSVGKNSLHIDKTFSKKAALLVYATVENWITISVPPTIKNRRQFEQFLKKTAQNKGIDVTKPFPFLLEGYAARFSWHVVRWRDGDTIHTHKKHRKSGMYGTMKDKEVTILGFYSNTHQSLFTDQDSNLHMHVKLEGNGVGGHVDDLTLERGMVLKLPNID